MPIILELLNEDFFIDFIIACPNRDPVPVTPIFTS